MTLRRCNDILSLIVIALGIYIMTVPFLPQLTYKFRDTSPDKLAPYAGVLAVEQGSSGSKPIPTDNRIVIPDIGIDEPILEGRSIGNTGGTWRRPNTATPKDDTNTVIVGHRFYGSNASTFYHLDKLLLGQKLAVYWEGEELIYEVAETKVVDANAIQIEAPTDERQLTLYTCTPLWTAKNRLVIIARPINQDNGEQNI